MGNFYLAIGATLLLFLPATINAQPIAVDPKLLQQLQETIDQQQEQLRKQAQQLQAQSEMLKSLQKQINDLRQPPALPPTVAAAAPKTAPPATITSGNDGIKLSISGQINRAVNITNDSYSTNVYHVDNDVSNSRVRLVGTAKMSDDLTLGTRIEVAVAPDESSLVSQSNQSPGDFFDERWAEVSLNSDKYGKLSMGKGDTASYTTAKTDLSKTDVVQYVNVSNISGGMLFREKGGALTTLKVSDAFKDLDGLYRKSRLRYDTPRFFGFGLAGSIVSGQRSDLALFWGIEGNGIKAAAATGVANPSLDNTGLQYDGSFSVLHIKSGLNLTVSGGLQERDIGNNATNFYTKLGWLADFTRIGTTAFGVDYTLSQNLPSSEDKGYSIGAAVVQSFDRFATELYLQYRIYSLDRKSGPAVGDINAGTFGARVKF
ncbi:MAG: hypothetical protein WC405_12140 [Syntrophales bacterium]